MLLWKRTIHHAASSSHLAALGSRQITHHPMCFIYDCIHHVCAWLMYVDEQYSFSPTVLLFSLRIKVGVRFRQTPAMSSTTSDNAISHMRLRLYNFLCSDRTPRSESRLMFPGKVKMHRYDPWFRGPISVSNWNPLIMGWPIRFILYLK